MGGDRDADVFVLPSQSENFGTRLRRRWQPARQWRVTEQCGIAPLLADEAGLVVKHDLQELTEALARILTDGELRRHFRAGCAKVHLTPGWEGPISEIQDLYARCLSWNNAGKS